MYRPWGILEKIITNPHTTGHAFILWHRRFQHYANYPIQFSSNTVLKSMWLRNLSVLHNISGKLHACIWYLQCVVRERDVKSIATKEKLQTHALSVSMYLHAWTLTRACRYMYEWWLNRKSHHSNFRWVCSVCWLRHMNHTMQPSWFFLARTSTEHTCGINSN